MENYLTKFLISPELMKIKIALLVIIILSICNVAASISITEIAYNPNGTDSGHEWIEIYSPSLINISGWKFRESNSNHRLTLINGSWLFSGYVIIADEWDTFLQDYPGFNGTLFDSSWSSLSNKGEVLSLLNLTLGEVATVNYSSIWGSHYLEKINLLGFNDEINWGSSLSNIGTPGKQNSLYGSCDWSISLLPEDEILSLEEEKSVLRWKVVLNENFNQGEVFFSYWIEDLTGNIVKAKVIKNTNSSETIGYFQKTFRYPQGYVLFAEIINSTCNDIDSNNNLVKQPIVITGLGSNYQNSESSLVINDYSPSSLDFGDVIKLTLNAYRGDSSKYAIYAYIEDDNGRKVSEKTTIHARTKFTNHSFVVPVLLKDNCNRKSKRDTYYIKVEGLDSSVSKEIIIEGIDKNKCEKSKKSSNTLRKSNSNSYQLKQLPSVFFPAMNFPVEIEIDNSVGDHNYAVWAYVYRGSKCYSCDDSKSNRDSNRKEINLKEGEKDIVTIFVNLDGVIEEGTYNLKIKINKDNQKTNKEITKSVYISKIDQLKSAETKDQILSLNNGKDEQSLNSTINLNPITKNSENLITGMVVYQSSSEKAKNLIPYLLFITFVLLGAVLIKSK